MKDKILGLLPYAITVLVVIVLIVCDLCGKTPASTEYDDLDEYARQLVESSEVYYNGIHYHGSYEAAEIMSLPEGFELVGISNMIVDDVELSNDCESHVLPTGYNIYASKNDESCIYILITSEEEMPQYIVYYKDITDVAMNILQ